MNRLERISRRSKEATQTKNRDKPNKEKTNKQKNKRKKKNIGRTLQGEDKHTHTLHNIVENQITF